MRLDKQWEGVTESQVEGGQRDYLGAEEAESERWREKRDGKGIEGEKCVCSQLLQPLGLRTKGGLEDRKSQNYSSVCRQWVRRWLTTQTKHVIRQRQKEEGQKGCT